MCKSYLLRNRVKYLKAAKNDVNICLVQRLINICDGNHPTASEMDEVKFLFSVAALIRKHPHLVHVFTLKVRIAESILAAFHLCGIISTFSVHLVDILLS